MCELALALALIGKNLKFIFIEKYPVNVLL